MKRRYIEDCIFYWVVLIFKGIFSLLPYRLALPLGAGFLYSLSLFYVRRFDVAYMNIKTVFPEKNPWRIKQLVRKSVFSLSLALMEFLLLSKLNKEKLLKLIEVKGKQRLDEVKGRGIIFLTAHYDNWELLSLVGALVGYPSYVIAREQKYPRLNSLLNRYRSRFGNVVVEKGFSLKKAIQALKKGKRIGILADQNAGKNGLQVKFFSQYVSTNPGFIYLAKRANALVFPVFIRRVSLFRHQLQAHLPLDLNKSEQEILQDYHRILEDYIRQNPEQWLWFHKRWKHSIEKRILVLSDSKPGHFKQSRVIARKLKNLIEERIQAQWPGEKGMVEIREVEVKWKSKLRKSFCLLLGIFSSSRCQGCLKCLSWGLEKDVYQKLIFQKWDYIISSGSSLLAVNVILAQENKAENVCILDPGLLYRRKFRKIFLPEHDRVQGKNIISYKGALVDEQEVIEKAKSFLAKNKLELEEEALRIGVLIGGDTKRAKLNIKIIRELFSFLERIAERRKLELLVTTSRRTPLELEDYLKEFLSSKPYKKLLILANRENPPGGVEAIIYLSQVIFVTSDSISMISEALPFSPNLFVVEASKLSRKGRIFLKGLQNSGKISLVSREFFKKSGDIFLHSPGKAKREGDTVILQALQELL